jgi:hypothetical protein
VSPPDTREGARCAIEVGRHPGPLWISADGRLIVCTEHKRQYQNAHDDYSDLEPWSLHDLDRLASAEVDASQEPAPEDAK